MKILLQIILLSTLLGLSLTLKCQVCEDGPAPGVCQDPEDEGVSKECQSWETACFFTKTVVNGGGSTAYRNCYMANTDYCQAYAYNGVSIKWNFYMALRKK